MIASFKAPKNYLSLPIGKVVGKHIKEVLPPQLAHARNCIKQAFSTNEGQIFEYQLVLDDEPPSL